MKSFQAQTHYEVLEISVGATESEVRNAYQRLSTLYSDDQVVLYGLIDPARAAALRTRLKEALEVLTDEQRRDAYDLKIGLPPRVPVARKSAAPAPKPSAPGSGANAATGWGTFSWVTPTGPAHTPTQPSAYTYAATPTKPVAAPAPVMVVPVPARLLAVEPPVPSQPAPKPVVVEPAVAEALPIVAAPVVPAPVVAAPVVAPSAPPEPSPEAPRQLDLGVSSGVPGWGSRPAPAPTPAPPPAELDAAPVPPLAAPIPQLAAPVPPLAPPVPPLAAPVPAPSAPLPAPSAPLPAPSAPPPVVEGVLEVASAPAMEPPPAPAPEPEKVTAPPEEPAIPILGDDVQVAIVPARATPSREFRVEQRPRPYEIPEGVEINGDLLKQVRMARGLSLVQVAERTRIGVKHLENVESDRYDALPAAVYLRGILMNLARELGLDGLRVSRSYLTFVEAHRSKG